MAARKEHLDSIERAPFSALLGLRIESRSNGTAVVRMPFAEALLNDGGPQAPIHGGAIASLTDVAACAAVWSIDATMRSATISMTVNYTGMASQSALVACATVRRHGKRLASVNVEIRDDAGALIADALVTYKIA